jgi:FtsP/CotA-like multicopper oxidase with cupredoxin domain
LRPRTCLTLIATSIIGTVPVMVRAQPSSVLPAGATLEQAGYEDYRRGIGRLESGVLRATLEVRAAAWRPWGETGAALRTHVFAADGAAARTPGPLIRVTAGTPVHVTVRNALPHALVMRGLRDRGAIPATAPPFTALVTDSLVVAPGETAEVRFTPTEPGTFLYNGKTIVPGEPPAPTPFPARPSDRALWGVLLVDPPAGAPATAPDERIFVITHWAERELPGTFLPATRFFINGRSWPHTERLEYAQGDTVRWRVINVTGRNHPMHLHGAYFSLDAKGDQLRDVVIPAAQRRLGVTETLSTTQTMRLSWIAHEPGNWLFHCHFMRHMSWLQASAPDAPPDRHAPHGSAGEDLMGGLVLGINVLPKPGHTPPTESARRRLDLNITRRPHVFGDAPGYGFVLQTGADAPAADSVRFPGSPILLTRGEPTEIVVHNRADVPLGVHWHGLELESWVDGVPGFSGTPGRVTAAIAPADSLRVRMTPPRSGTFMYHVHSEPGHQLAQGLYGPLLVLEPGQPWDRASDRVFLLGSLGTGDDPPPAINGELGPAPIELHTGTTYRLRFMHISPDDDKQISLLAADSVQQWRMVAKDGADLPPSQVRTVPARLRINVGETYDYLWTPNPGSYELHVVTIADRGVAAFPRVAPPPHTARVLITVR